MGTAIVMSAIGVVGCVALVAVARVRGSRYALALGVAFGALFLLMVAVTAGGYVDCEQRGDCPAGIGVVKVAYFGLLGLIALMLLGGLALLAKVPAVREGGLGRDLGLTMRIVVVVAILGVLYLLAALTFAVFLIAAVEQRSWPVFLLFLVVGAGPVALLTWQALRADELALRAARARVLEPGEQPELQLLTTRLALAADLPSPRVAVARSREANAFSVGLTPGRATIVVTTALLRRLDEGQLKGVIAHELAHVANRDGAVMTVASAPAMLGSLLFRLKRGFVLFILYLPVWLLGLVLLWTMSRAREYYADRGSAHITGAPEQLMSALQELGGKTATSDLRGVAMRALCIVRPGRRKWYEPDFSHPAIDKRIDRLAELARQLARAPIRG